MPDYRACAVPVGGPRCLHATAGQARLHPQAAKALSELIAPRAVRADIGPPLSSRAPRVLCVDDNPANLLLVQTLLEDMGAEVVAVEGGYAAVNAVQQEASDPVLMDADARHGRSSGHRGDPRPEAERNQSSLPIVALTAHAMANEKRSLLQSGMDDYLTKPISERQLAQVVLKWTGLALRNPAPERQNEALEVHVGPLVLDHEEGLRGCGQGGSRRRHAGHAAGLTGRRPRSHSGGACQPRM